MKHDIRKLQVQDLAIGDWVTGEKSTPMYVAAIFEDGWLYLSFKDNTADPIERKVDEVTGILLTKPVLRHFGFAEIEHNVFEKQCDGFKVRVVVFYVDKACYVRAIVEHSDGGYRFDDNIAFVHQLQHFVFDNTKKGFYLDYQ